MWYQPFRWTGINASEILLLVRWQDLDLRILRSFLAVAQTGTVSGAARELHLSQPAVTAHLRRLEEVVGQALLVRSSSGVRLTRSGQVLRQLSSEIQGTMVRIGDVFRQKKELTGRLSFGASLTIAAYVMPLFVPEFVHQHPAIEIEMRVDNSAAILGAVREDLYSFGLVEGHARAGGLRLSEFVRDEVVLVAGVRGVSKSYAKLGESILTVGDLAKVPIIWRETGSGTRAVVESALRKAGLSPKRLDHRYVIADITAAKTAVRLGMGFSFISRWAVREELANGHLRIIPVSGLAIQRGFYWVLPGGALGEPGDSFVRFCESHRTQLNRVSG
jgi:molybdate transport repressor ModE-like protein